MTLDKVYHAAYALKTVARKTDLIAALIFSYAAAECVPAELYTSLTDGFSPF